MQGRAASRARRRDREAMPAEPRKTAGAGSGRSILLLPFGILHRESPRRRRFSKLSYLRLGFHDRHDKGDI